MSVYKQKILYVKSEKGYTIEIEIRNIKNLESIKDFIRKYMIQEDLIVTNEGKIIVKIFCGLAELTEENYRKYLEKDLHFFAMTEVNFYKMKYEESEKKYNEYRENNIKTVKKFIDYIFLPMTRMVDKYLVLSNNIYIFGNKETTNEHNKDKKLEIHTKEYGNVGFENENDKFFENCDCDSVNDDLEECSKNLLENMKKRNREEEEKLEKELKKKYDFIKKLDEEFKLFNKENN